MDTREVSWVSQRLSFDLTWGATPAGAQRTPSDSIDSASFAERPLVISEHLTAKQHRRRLNEATGCQSNYSITAT